MRLQRILLGATCAVAGLAAFAGGPVEHAAHPTPGRYIVTLDPGASAGGLGDAGLAPRVPGIAADLRFAYGGNVERVFQHALHGFVLVATPAQAEALARDARVARVEEDGEVHATTTETNATWGLDRIDQHALPLDHDYVYDGTGSGVTAYVIDTGIRATHTELAGRVRAGYTAISDGNGTNDCNGHGTHVSGTIAGSTYGVAKQATLVPVRVLDCNGSGSTSGVIAGIDWVTANHSGPSVANMSLGGGASSTLDDAVRRSISSGVTFSVAAGNDNADACNTSPARTAQALTVGASTSGDARASFSNYGTCVDLFAPGYGITSAWNTSDTATNTISGTSMATPHVTGVAALYLGSHPTALPAEVASAITSGATAGVISSANGSPNLLLYSRLTGSGGGTDQPPAARFTFTCTGLACQFDGSTSTDDHGLASYDWAFGDGALGSGVKSSHTYATAGTYQVTLTVKDTVGQSNASTKPVTVSGSGGAPCTSCESYTGSLAGPGSVSYQPRGNYFYDGNAGTHQGWLSGPANTNFDLTLFKWVNGAWTAVASSRTATSTEAVTYAGTAGYYLWRINSVSGSGTYGFWMKRP